MRKYCGCEYVHACEKCLSYEQEKYYQELQELEENKDDSKANDI